MGVDRTLAPPSAFIDPTFAGALAGQANATVPVPGHAADGVDARRCVPHSCIDELYVRSDECAGIERRNRDVEIRRRELEVAFAAGHGATRGAPTCAVAMRSRDTNLLTSDRAAAFPPH